MTLLKTIKKMNIYVSKGFRNVLKQFKTPLMVTETTIPSTPHGGYPMRDALECCYEDRGIRFNLYVEPGRWTKVLMFIPAQSEINLQYNSFEVIPPPEDRKGSGWRLAVNSVTGFSPIYKEEVERWEWSADIAIDLIKSIDIDPATEAAAEAATEAAAEAATEAAAEAATEAATEEDMGITRIFRQS